MKLNYLIYWGRSINLLVIVIKLTGDVMTEMTKPENQQDSLVAKSKGRGRPKCFNEQEALEKAMLLFWQYGYEATSISDLTQALGITAPSLYSSFGGKAALFEKCLDYYLENEACSMDQIFIQAKSTKIAIELYLFENLKRLIQNHKPVGCMLVVATMNCSTENSAIQQQLLERRQHTKSKIHDRLVLGQQLGDIPDHADVQAMTDYYTTLIQGMTIQARDGAELGQLENVVKMAMKSWDIFIQDL